MVSIDQVTELNLTHKVEFHVLMEVEKDGRVQ
jgi:hypothetical protein